MEGGEGVADTTSNRLQRDRFARSETGRTRCARRADARDGIGQRTVTYDFARLMEGASEVKCSEFGDALIGNM